ncbi:MAG TPA: glycosyltransferase family 39 protein [Phycisphaerae bacterium]|nr:glycosyltransferase family 39 protein [Phycisphaerae bacterium]
MKSGWLWAILAAGLVARMWLYAAASSDTVLTPDSETYWRLGRSLIERGEFARDDRPEIFRTPGYPAFLAIAQLADRGDSLDVSPPGWRLALTIQILLDLMLVLVVYLLGRFLVSHRAGLVAAALQAVSPLVLGASCRILSDSLYALLFTVAVLLIVGYLRTGRAWPLISSAGVLGVACYFRPVGLAMAALFAVFVLLRPRRLARAAVFVGVFAAVLLPWTVRNAVRADYFGFSSFASDSMYYFAAAEVVARKEGIDGEAARAKMRWEDYERNEVAQRATVGAAARYRRRRAMEIILADPGTYVKLHLKGCLGVWIPGATDVLEVAGVTAGNRNTREVLRREGIGSAVRHYFGGNAKAIALAVPLILILAAKYVGVLACAIAGVRRRAGPEVWLLVSIALLTAILPGPFGLPRYRIPIEPILNLAAAAGLLALWGAVRRTRA